MTVRINAPDVGEDRLFEYEIVPDRNYGPYFAMIGWVEAIMSADRPGGPMTLESTLRIHLTRGRTLERHDLLSGDTMPAMITGYHLMDYLGNLLNNPFELVKIEKIEVEATLRQRLDFGVVVNARLDRDAYRPGETANLQVWLQRWRGGISDFAIPLRLPADLEDGEYELQLLDGSGRESLEFQLRPEIRRPIEINQVLEGLQIAYPSNQLYLVLLREIDGMALSGKALPELPGSVMTAMQVSAPAHKTVPITLEKILENRKTFSYEVGGMRSLPVRVNRRIPD